MWARHLPSLAETSRRLGGGFTTRYRYQNLPRRNPSNHQRFEYCASRQGLCHGRPTLDMTRALPSLTGECSLIKMKQILRHYLNSSSIEKIFKTYSFNSRSNLRGKRTSLKKRRAVSRKTNLKMRVAR